MYTLVCVAVSMYYVVAMGVLIGFFINAYKKDKHYLAGIYASSFIYVLVCCIKFLTR